MCCSLPIFLHPIESIYLNVNFYTDSCIDFYIYLVYFTRIITYVIRLSSVVIMVSFPELAHTWIKASLASRDKAKANINMVAQIYLNL